MAAPGPATPAKKPSGISGLISGLKGAVTTTGAASTAGTSVVSGATGFASPASIKFGSPTKVPFGSPKMHKGAIAAMSSSLLPTVSKVAIDKIQQKMINEDLEKIKLKASSSKNPDLPIPDAIEEMLKIVSDNITTVSSASLDDDEEVEEEFQNFGEKLAKEYKNTPLEVFEGIAMRVGDYVFDLPGWDKSQSYQVNFIEEALQSFINKVSTSTSKDPYLKGPSSIRDNPLNHSLNYLSPANLPQIWDANAQNVKPEDLQYVIRNFVDRPHFRWNELTPAQAKQIVDYLKSLPNNNYKYALLTTFNQFALEPIREFRKTATKASYELELPIGNTEFEGDTARLGYSLDSRILGKVNTDITSTITRMDASANLLTKKARPTMKQLEDLTNSFLKGIKAFEKDVDDIKDANINDEIDTFTPILKAGELKDPKSTINAYATRIKAANPGWKNETIYKGAINEYIKNFKEHADPYLAMIERRKENAKKGLKYKLKPEPTYLAKPIEGRPLLKEFFEGLNLQHAAENVAQKEIDEKYKSQIADAARKSNDGEAATIGSVNISIFRMPKGIVKHISFSHPVSAYDIARLAQALKADHGDLYDVSGKKLFSVDDSASDVELVTILHNPEYAKNGLLFIPKDQKLGGLFLGGVLTHHPYGHVLDHNMLDDMNFNNVWVKSHSFL